MRNKKVKDIPCCNCDKEKQCSAKVNRTPQLGEILDYMYESNKKSTECIMYQVLSIEDGSKKIYDEE